MNSFEEWKRRRGKDVPDKILYVTAVVQMSDGRVLPKIISLRELPIDLKGFFFIKVAEKCRLGQKFIKTDEKV